VTSFFGIKVRRFCFFLETTRQSATNFFTGFRTKHLFITTCIEKRCTRPLNSV